MVIFFEIYILLPININYFVCGLYLNYFLGLLFLGFPFAGPIYFIVSAINKKVRSCRGISCSINSVFVREEKIIKWYTTTIYFTLFLFFKTTCFKNCFSGIEDKQSYEEDAPFWKQATLTKVASNQFAVMMKWEWTNVIGWSYIWGILVFVLMVMFTKGLNLFLVWLSAILADFETFAVIIIAARSAALLPPIAGQHRRAESRLISKFGVDSYGCGLYTCGKKVIRIRIC